MYLIYKEKYFFKEDIKTQLNHLKDLGHMPKVHKISLFGAKLLEVKRHNKSTLRFKLSRFGLVSDFILEYKKLGSKVTNGKFTLDFLIKEAVNGHYLEVKYYSVNKILKYFTGIIGFLFWLTIQEDKNYFKKEQI